MSRLAGVLRDATIARFLGASALSDAFYTAFRIPNTFRAIVGEGGLPGAFVPMARKVARERPGEEGAYAGRVLSLLLLVLVALTALGVALAPLLVRLFAEGFRNVPGKYELTVTLTRWLFPYILLVSAAALLEAFLNAKGRFQADLYSLARRQLAEAGVASVHGGTWCTASDPRRFFSFRRDGTTGRMATLAWLG